MKIEYRDPALSKPNIEKLMLINAIISEYQNEGYRLTLRQLYYQLVSRGIIPNKSAEYGKLSHILKEGRMSGLVDWEAIEDRLRVPYTPPAFSTALSGLNALISQFEIPRQQGQDIYLEVWVEKDALSGVLKRVTSKYHVPILVNRGYSSATAVHDAHERFEEMENVVVLYLGDFDPSGLDMIRDIRFRILEFKGDYDFEILPIALTLEQIQEHDPPPNPAKLTDPRAKDFILVHGNQSWEVDALRPDVLHSLLEASINDHIDLNLFESVLKRESEEINSLKDLRKYLI